MPGRLQNTPVSRQKGVALITVMLIVALATTVAATMASQQQLDIRRTENTLFYGQAMMYSLGVEQWVRQILIRDFRDNKTDHLGEDWAVKLPPLPVEGGLLKGAIEDLQARFNLNNLQQTGKAGKRAKQRFQRLLRALELDESLANTVLDWLDNDQEARFPGGAEDVYYLGIQPAYRSADQMMQSPSELLLLKELPREAYKKLLPHVCTLPRVTPININTASAEVLATLSDDLKPADFADVIKQREKDPFTSVENFLSDKIFAGKNIPKEGLSVNSEFFLLHSEVLIGHIQQRYATVLERDNTGMIRTLVRSQGEI